MSAITTITSSDEIGAILRRGKRSSSPLLSVFYLKQDNPSKVRVAFIAGKKNGNAVWRNLAKRKLRAAFRATDVAAVGYDFVLIANRKTTTVSSVEIADSLNSILIRSGLIQ